MQILAVFAFRSNVHLTFLVFFLHDIARTAEIHTKTTHLDPRSESGAPKYRKNKPEMKFGDFRVALLG